MRTNCLFRSFGFALQLSFNLASHIEVFEWVTDEEMTTRSICSQSNDLRNYKIPKQSSSQILRLQGFAYHNDVQKLLEFGPTNIFSSFQMQDSNGNCRI